MVLTNFECWAHGEADAPNFETGPRPRHSNVDPFNARVVASSSNGYYGYAIVNNAAAAASDNNNNNNMQDMQMHENAATDSSNAAARCNKKRCFVMGLDEQLDMEMMDNLTTVKRCRYDDGDLVAQYCNDFFSLPATQVIGTQSCLMESDYDMQAEQPPQQQQQQHQEQQQQQQQQHPRIQQHYQDRPQQEQQSQVLRIESLNCKDLKLAKKHRIEAADLYIATHGGCLHHLQTDLEPDI